MTVRELIAKLQSEDQNALVLTYYPGGGVGVCDYYPVTKIYDGKFTVFGEKYESGNFVRVRHDPNADERMGTPAIYIG